MMLNLFVCILRLCRVKFRSADIPTLLGNRHESLSNRSFAQAQRPAKLPLQAMAPPFAFNGTRVLEEDDDIEQLLQEATNSHLRQGDVPPNSWGEARNIRITAIRAARKRALASRTRRPAKETRPRPLNYEVDVCQALLKYNISYPHTLEEAASAIQVYHHRDAARALRIVFVKLLFGSTGFNDAKSQMLLEETLDFYGLTHKRSAFLLALHKHFNSEEQV